MRHAPQARFDNFAQIEARVTAYTLQQIESWTETDFNWHMREALGVQGFDALHIREANETGVADLIVYRTITVTGIQRCEFTDLQVIRAWLELKMDNDPDRKNVRAGQVEFMREHWRAGRNALFVAFDRKVGMLAVRQGDWKGRVKMLPPSPYATRWQEVFDHFKARQVSV